MLHDPAYREIDTYVYLSISKLNQIISTSIYLFPEARPYQACGI